MNIYHVRQQLRMKSIYDMNLRFVYYARVSSDKEEQKNSIINQRLYYEQFITPADEKTHGFNRVDDSPQIFNYV